MTSMQLSSRCRRGTSNIQKSKWSTGESGPPSFFPAAESSVSTSRSTPHLWICKPTKRTSVLLRNPRIGHGRSQVIHVLNDLLRLLRQRLHLPQRIFGSRDRFANHQG